MYIIIIFLRVVSVVLLLDDGNGTTTNCTPDDMSPGVQLSWFRFRRLYLLLLFPRFSLTTFNRLHYLLLLFPILLQLFPGVSK